MTTIKEQVELDERNCVLGSLAHDRKLAKEREEYLKSIAIKGGCVSNRNA